MMKSDRHYQVLELEPGASLNDVKQAYRDLVRVWHPDRFSDDLRLQQKAEEKLRQINAAYEFLKSYQPPVDQKVERSHEQAAENIVNCGNLEKLLELGNLKAADQETKRLLLEWVGREREGWLRPEDVKSLSSSSLAAIDRLWIKHSNGRFGFSVQSKIWRQLGCHSSANTSVQTSNENRFGQFTHWRVGGMWLSPWDVDSLKYDMKSPQGSLPRDYIFTLSGWWSYSKGWTGYLLWRFDEIFLKI